MKNISSFSLIGERYLDTQHDVDYIERLESELARRGVVGIKRYVMEYLAASSLWWNLFVWEWTELNAQDVKQGWIANIVVFGVMALLTGMRFGWLGFSLAFLGLHAVTTTIGLALRSGSAKLSH